MNTFANHHGWVALQRNTIIEYLKSRLGLGQSPRENPIPWVRATELNDQEIVALHQWILDSMSGNPGLSANFVSDFKKTKIEINEDTVFADRAPLNLRAKKIDFDDPELTLEALSKMLLIQEDEALYKQLTGMESSEYVKQFTRFFRNHRREIIALLGKEVNIQRVNLFSENGIQRKYEVTQIGDDYQTGLSVVSAQQTGSSRTHLPREGGSQVRTSLVESKTNIATVRKPNLADILNRGVDQPPANIIINAIRTVKELFTSDTISPKQLVEHKERLAAIFQAEGMTYRGLLAIKSMDLKLAANLGGIEHTPKSMTPLLSRRDVALLIVLEMVSQNKQPKEVRLLRRVIGEWFDKIEEKSS